MAEDGRWRLAILGLLTVFFVLGVYGGRPVYLKDVATVQDGPEEPRTYVWMGSGPAAPSVGLAAWHVMPARTPFGIRPHCAGGSASG